jgi:Toprim-like
VPAGRVPRAVAEARGWTPAALDRLGVGYDGERVTFTVRDATGDEVGLLRYSPNGAEPKMLADAGTSRELYPPPEDIADDEVERWLWLVEGEPDATRNWSLGLPAVAVPGAQNWRDELAARFSGRPWRVVVCFDCDQAGRTNALRAARALIAAGVDARVLDLDPSRDDGFDLTDFTRGARTESEREQMRRLLLHAADHAPEISTSLASLLDQTEAFVRRFLTTLSDAHFCLLALWVAHTYVVGAAETTP